MRANDESEKNEDTEWRFALVSAGPGDPSLLTYSAIQTLTLCECIYLPTRDRSGNPLTSRVYSILKGWEESFQNGEDKLTSKVKGLYSSMKLDVQEWESQLKPILKDIQSHKRVAYLTLGDAAVYSTAYYLLLLIQKNHKELFDKSIVVPGVTSYSQASAKIKRALCLGDSELLIRPHALTESKRTTVYMRPAKESSPIKEEGELYYFQKLNFEGENYGRGYPPSSEPYMTLFVDFNDRTITHK